MPNTPNNRPAGRQRVGGGQGKDVSAHGPGLGTGPVGKSDGYSARRPGGEKADVPRGSGSGGGEKQDVPRGSGFGGGERALPISKGKLILIGIGVILLLIVGGKVLSSMSGDSGGSNGSGLLQNLAGQNGAGDAGNNNGGSGGIASLLGGLGSFSGNSAYADTGSWDGANNTGKLNTSVASGARAKRTVIKGGGQDTVTLMVYVCGTDLESKRGMASADLKEMASATLSDKVNVIVLTGGCKGWKTQGISNEVNQIYKVENGKLKTLDQNRGKGAMTDPATLTDFIKYCKTNYPANRNALILWDHGGGTVSGFGYDERNTKSGSMTLAKVASAIKNAGVSFDFIGFDACLMATLETALVLDPVADYLIASEETEPGIGWYYTNWLTSLSKNTSISTVELGKLIADDFVSTCASKAAGQKATLSVIDLAELSATVGDKLSDFSTATANQISGSGYKTVSEARGNTREFAASNKIDQVDLVHLALNLNTAESKALAQTLLSAVKYNKTSSNMTNAYGISAYFPYRSANKVAGAVQQLDALGMDEEYTKCVKKFASLEVSGQASGGGSASPVSTLFGSLTGGGSSGGSSSGGVSDIIGSLLGGGSSAGGLDLTSLLGGTGLFDRSLTQEEIVAMVEDVMIDDSALVWTEEDGVKVLVLSEEQWSNVADLQLNVFLDDGKGYIDLGMDNVFSWTESGALAGVYDNMWVSLNSQPVAYYFTGQTLDGDETVYNGRVPVLLNGDRAELLIEFKGDRAYVAGARFIYTDGETDTVAKADTALADGDVIQPICDYYTYDGAYQDTYLLGDEITVSGDIQVSDVVLSAASGTPCAYYVLTDRFNMEHWTPQFN